jgi:outer membrane protein assembly factor BamD (BamD/ComL family)
MVGRLARLALLIAVIAALSGLSGGACAGQAEKRVALVIGNNDYQNFQPLTNPVNDADNLKAALESINFDIVYFKNMTLRQFYQALKEFNKRSKGADVALVYYAGHAVQFHGRNYLIQVDDEAETLEDINIGSIPVDKILDVLATVKGVKILVLDACRDNPAKGKATNRSIVAELNRDVGLARLDDYDTSGGRGMVIAYATSANHVAADGEGKNSPYNVALAKWITAVDMTVPDIFTNITGTVVGATNGRQHPIFDSSLIGNYVLNPTGSEWVDWAKVQNSTDVDQLQRFLDAHPDSAHAPIVKRQLEVQQQNLAEAAWDRIKDGSDLTALQAFRNKFPNSAHAAEADRKIADLRQKAEDAERAVEAAWDRLKTSTDVSALQAFRTANPSSPHAAEAAERLADLQRKAADAQKEATEWSRVRDSQDPAALQNFLDRYPGSQYTADAQRKLLEAQQKIEAQRSENAWDQIKNSADIAALERFRYAYPNSPHAAEVDQKIAAAQEKADADHSDKAWADLKSSSDVAALQAFKDRYPRSPHVAEAERRIQELGPRPSMGATIDDASAWYTAKTSNSISELQAFKSFFPNSAHVAEADKAIAALQNAGEEKKRKEAEAADEEKRREAEGEKAKQAEEACKQEASDVADFVKARSEGA